MNEFSSSASFSRIPPRGRCWHKFATTRGNNDDENDDAVVFDSSTNNEMTIDDIPVKDLPMFSTSYNPDSVDLSQVPLPPFTAAVVFFFSTAFTIYLYYVGITGGTAENPVK